MSVKLLGRLGSSSSNRVVPLHGPAGSGKTHAIAAARSGSATPFVHFRARPYHAHIDRFVRGIVDELGGDLPLAGLAVSNAIAASHRASDPAASLGLWFAGQLGKSRRVVALDDLHHVLDAPGLRDFIVSAVGHAAADIRFALGARDTFAWPMARWLADATACVPLGFATSGVAAPPDADLAAWIETLDEPHAGALRVLALLPRFDARISSRIPGAAQAVASLEDRFAGALDGDRLTTNVARAILDATTACAASARAVALEALACAPATQRLQVAIELDARPEIIAILDRDGFAMNDDSHGDLVDAAIAHLSLDERRTSALALSLEAKREMDLGRHDVGESWYLHAAALAATPEARARVERAHGANLLRRSRADAVDLLERVATASVSPSFDAMAAATLAAAYAAAERWAEARTTMRRALAVADAWPQDENVAIRAVVYRQAAYVSLRDGEPANAATYARRAIAAAELCGADETVASAISVLLVVAISHEDDGDAAIALPLRLERCARRLDNAFLLRYSRLALIDAYGERAAWPDVDRIEALLSEQELENDTRHTEETLVRIRALRMAGSGNFSGAAGLLGAAVDEESEPDMLALRSAEFALYAAASGDRESARGGIARVDVAVAGLQEHSTIAVRATLYAALADLAGGDVASARRRVRRATFAAAPYPRMRIFCRAVEHIVRVARAQGDASYAPLLDALADLYDCGLGGIAALIGALPVASLRSRAS